MIQPTPRELCVIAAAEIEWHVQPGLTDYADALATMVARVEAIGSGKAAELIWLVEHPPVYTSGTSAKTADLIDPKRFPVHAAGRGGQYTYHGPGQRVVYIMLDLNRRGRDLRCFVAMIEKWIVAALAQCGVESFISPGRVGVWVKDQESEAKIAAIGVRVRRWVSFHGAAINVNPDLEHFSGIVPCGLPDRSVTSLRALGSGHGMYDIDQALRATFGAFIEQLHYKSVC
jgi:lipoyl(octanoyl) transferase